MDKNIGFDKNNHKIETGRMTLNEKCEYYYYFKSKRDTEGVFKYSVYKLIRK